MPSPNALEFACLHCSEPVAFSVFDLNEGNKTITCEHCQKKYIFDDENLLRQLKIFEKLCTQIRESEEILGKTSVGIDIGAHHVQVPFKLLLTRLSTSLDLVIGEKNVSIMFRVEPTEGLSEALIETVSQQ